jgi:hypothetical protein
MESLACFWLASHHPFPGKLCLLEIQEQGHFETGNVEAPNHLGDVRFIEGGHDFWIGNDFAVHNKVRHELADLVTAIVDRIFALLLECVAARGKFDDERILVKFFIQTWFQFIQHGNRTEYDRE